MSGGTFIRCAKCDRIVIYGQTCTCGNDTNGQGDRSATRTIRGILNEGESE